MPTMSRLLPNLLLLLVCAAGWRTAIAADAAVPSVSPAQARLARIEALRAERPRDAALVFYQARALVALDRRDDALDALRSLRGRSLGVIPAAGAGFEPIEADAAFRALRAELAAEEARTPEAPVRLLLPDPGLLPEGIAWHAATRRLFVGSVARRRIVAVDAQGRTRSFSRPEDRLDAVLGLHVDAARAQLLAVSTNGFLDEAARERRNAVLRYALRGPRQVQRLAAPEARQLNDVTAAADGTVYASDSAAGRLFIAAPGAAELRPWTAVGSLPGANGVAVAPDGMLYVATSTGITRVDPADASISELPQPNDVVSAAIDGLYWHDGDLVGIQNVTSPGRVVRFVLADAGRRIAAATVLQSHHHPEWDEPTTGAVVGSSLLVIANSQLGRQQPDGSLREPRTLRRTRVLTVPLRR